MGNATGHIVDWAVFGQARAELGADFVRILGYFREDGVKSVAAIEEAMRARSAGRPSTSGGRPWTTPRPQESPAPSRWRLI